ncbi:zinc metallopeptidase [soil metagenome]
MALYILIFVVTMAFSLIAAGRVKSKYAKWSKFPARSGLSGAQAAAQILRQSGIGDVEIVAGKGHLTDHYDPAHKRLVLSETNYHGHSVAALGIAAHECGHAVQHARAYAPLQWRMAAVGLTRFSSPMLYLPIIGMALGLLAPYTGFLIIAVGMGIMMLFNLVTLPVEFDATKRAKAILAESGMISPGEEEKGMSAVLDAAAWTYVAAFVTSLAWFLYYLLPLILGGRR